VACIRVFALATRGVLAIPCPAFTRARACVEGTDGVGTAVTVPNVLSEGGFIDGSGQLVVGVAVKNLAFTK
jgi:hypothetical protein